VYGEQNVFFDKEKLLTGDDWAAKLEREVKNAKAVIA
jgi:hypothetical protein